MAVKPITNKQVVNKSSVNRGQQTSTRNVTARGGTNFRSSFVPGKDFDKNYAVTLKDVDSSILSHVKDVMRPTIRESNELVKVPVYYGNQERWKSARKSGVLRDKQGSLLLPLVMMKRINVDKSTELHQSFKHDVKRQHVEVTRNSSWSKTNRYDRFSVETGIKPVAENLATTMPSFVNVTYEFILWTNFMEQMNFLIESFVEHNDTYWGDSNDYKFLSTIESISDATEMDQAGDRFIKSTFTLLTKSYLLPEETNSVVTNKLSQLQKTMTPRKVIFGYEGDATDFQVEK
jgi:hypothetical protein